MAGRDSRRPVEAGAVILPRVRPSARRTARVVWIIARRTVPAYVRASRGERRKRAIDALGHAFVELGPTFIKIGQLISANPVMFPAAVVEAFARCQDRCDPQPRRVVEQILAEDLGAPVGVRFRSFEPQPIASGSIAQVHRAVTLDGDQVAVKVQRLGLARILALDLAMFSFAARVLVRLRPAYAVTNPAGAIEDFRHSLSEELAFLLEARRMDELREVYADWPIVVPRTYAALTTDRVLTMELVEGVKPDDPDKLVAAGLDPAKVADLLVSSFIYAALTTGLFHGDGHPGNLAVLDDNRICLYDYGIMGRLADDDRIQLSRFLRSLGLQQFDVTAEALLTIADLSEANLVEAMADVAVLFGSDVINQDGAFRLADIDHAKMLAEFLAVANRHNMILPVDLVLFFKQLLYLNGLANTLAPDLSVFDGGRFFEYFAPDDGMQAHGA